MTLVSSLSLADPNMDPLKSALFHLSTIELKPGTFDKFIEHRTRYMVPAVKQSGG